MGFWDVPTNGRTDGRTRKDGPIGERSYGRTNLSKNGHVDKRTYRHTGGLEGGTGGGNGRLTERREGRGRGGGRTLLFGIFVCVLQYSRRLVRRFVLSFGLVGLFARSVVRSLVC